MQDRLDAMNAQLKGMPKGGKGGQGRDLRKQKAQLKQELKSQPAQWRLEQRTYRAGTTPLAMDIGAGAGAPRRPRSVQWTSTRCSRASVVAGWGGGGHAS
jgi:hypothetical protein